MFEPKYALIQPKPLTPVRIGLYTFMFVTMILISLAILVGVFTSSVMLTKSSTPFAHSIYLCIICFLFAWQQLGRGLERVSDARYPFAWHQQHNILFALCGAYLFTVELALWLFPTRELNVSLFFVLCVLFVALFAYACLRFLRDKRQQHQAN